MPPISPRRPIHPDGTTFRTVRILNPFEDGGTLRTAGRVLKPVTSDQFKPPITTLTVPLFITVIEEEVERVTRLVTVGRTMTASPTPTFTISPIVFQRSSASPISSSTSASSSTFLSNSLSQTPSTVSSETTSALPSSASLSSTLSSSPSSSIPSSIPSSTPSSTPSSSTSSITSFISTSSIHTATPSPSKPSPSPSSREDFPSPVIPSTPAAAQTPVKPLSPGVVVGITLSSVLFALLLAICFIRRRSKSNREKARTWVTPFVETKPIPVTRQAVDRKQEKRMEFLSERWQRIRSSRILSRVSSGGPGNASRSAASGASNSRQKRRRNQRGAPITEPPREPIPRPPVYREPYAGGPADMFVSSMFPHGAVARCDFQPRRPDELAILAGDHLRVTALYDDGWAMCKNDAGQRGVVPTSCLRVDRARR